MSAGTGVEAAVSKQFIIPVIRENDASTLENICLALADGGLLVQEITLMSEAALQVIKKLSGRLTLGAGTVLTPEQAVKAKEAGARFLVSPGLNIEAIEATDLPFFPGVLTPSEIMQARFAGCNVLKIFPISSVGGASYLASLRGPFPTLQWFPSGGVSFENMREYKKAGAFAVGMGGNLVAADAIANKEFNRLTKAAANHLRAINE
jgi:2-dehydro-3-deoxyphosphogluconate aldolase/(4S)-4-hydroxy-2-oxoglutarate aldolase